jgi:PTH1 family peptidyl-tRNA hydrolase
VRVGGKMLVLAIPHTYMNESGLAVRPLAKRYLGPEPGEHLVIVHDELDLEPGRLQLKFGGGLAGHNGLRSIAQTLGTNDFARLRIGIGKPLRKEQGADYVLSRPSGTRKKTMSEDVAAAADVIEAMIDLGFDEARQRVNSPRD